MRSQDYSRPFLEAMEPRLLLDASLTLTPNIIDEDGTTALNGSFEAPVDTPVVVVSIDWGDGSSLEQIPLAEGLRQFDASHQYLDDVPSGSNTADYTVNVEINEEATLIDTGQAVITVNNVAPEITRLGTRPPDVLEGEVMLVGAFEDTGTLDVHTVEIDWGDGSNPSTYTLTTGDRVFRVVHTLSLIHI